MLFEPFEVRVTRRNIDTFLRADNGLCMETVRKDVLSLARNKDKVLYSIRINQMKPDQLALTLIYNVLTRNLQSGMFHVYRGMLSMEGRDMLRLWRITAKELVNRGYCSNSEYESESAGLMDEIRSMG